MSDLAEIDLQIVVVNIVNPNLAEIRERLPDADVTVESAKSSGMSAEEFGLQVLISVVGSYTFAHINTMLKGLSSLIQDVLPQRSGKPLIVVVEGIEHEITSESDIEAFEQQLRVELAKTEVL